IEAGTGRYDTPETNDNGPFSSHSANGLGAFSATAESEFFNVFHDRMFARATQSSSLGANAMHSTGTIEAKSADDLAFYRSIFDVTFDVNTKASYSLLSTVDLPSVDGASNPLPLFTLNLRRLPASGTAGATLVHASYTPSQ